MDYHEVSNIDIFNILKDLRLKKLMSIIEFSKDMKISVATLYFLSEENTKLKLKTMNSIIKYLFNHGINIYSFIWDGKIIKSKIKK